MSILDQLRKKPPVAKPAILIYSKHGGGKTSFAARFKKPVFLIHHKEDGIGDLQSAGLADGSIPVFTAMDWQAALDCVDGLINDPHDFETLVIDELGGFEELLYQYVGDKEFDGDMSNEGFFSFQNGPNKIAPMYFAKFTDKLAELRTKRQMTVIVLSHSKVKTFTDPQRPAYDRIIPACGELTAAAIMEWVTTIGFIDFVIEVATPDGKNGKKRARGGSQRQLHLTPAAVYEAKNRWSITEPVDLGETADEGYANFQAAVIEAVKANKAAQKASNTKTPTDGSN